MDVSKELSLLCENALEILSKEELETRLQFSKKNKKPLRIKAGFDPSAPDIHLGHTVLLRKLRQFQDLGHQVVFIIGDTTAMIGDPTGKNQTRPALSKKEVEMNAKTYQRQAFKILDKDPKKIEVLRNSDWLGRLLLKDFLENVASRFTIARILERDDFEKRMAQNQPISIREFTYPILQAYDSVIVKADVEIGGTDQKFNLLAGRDLQKAFGQKPQIVMTFPLLVGLDGTQKMSKSLGNTVGVTDSAKEMFGKIMSIPDASMEIYFNLLTSCAGKNITQQVQSGELHPRNAKKKLAVEIVSSFYGEKTAIAEAGEFDRIFRQKQTPDELAEFELPEAEIWIVDLLRKTSLVESGGQARALIQQGAVTLDGQKVTDAEARICIKNGAVLKAGKRRFVKLITRSK